MALIKKIEEYRQYLPVSYASKMDTLPGFEEAENLYLRPVLGDTLLNELITAYEAGSQDEKQKTLTSYCRRVIVPFAFLDALPFMQTTLTSNGLIAMEAQDTRKAYRWEYNEVTNALTANAYAAQEGLITFLLQHGEQYPAFLDSPLMDNDQIGLIRSGADLKGISGLMHPHRCYTLIRPLIADVISMQLYPLIGEDFYTAFNVRLLTGTLSSDDKKLLPVLRSTLIRRLMQYASVELGVTFTGNGFIIADWRSLRDSKDEGKQSASDSQLERHLKQMEQTAGFFASEVTKLLNEKASATVFPEYFNSPLYPIQTQPVNPNDGKRGTFIM